MYNIVCAIRQDTFVVLKLIYKQLPYCICDFTRLWLLLLLLLLRRCPRRLLSGVQEKVTWCEINTCAVDLWRPLQRSSSCSLYYRNKMDNPVNVIVSDTSNTVSLSRSSMEDSTCPSERGPPPGILTVLFIERNTV